MLDLKQLYNAVLEGNMAVARSTAEQALAEGINPQQLVTECVIPAMNEVGRRFECNDYFVPELMLANRAMKAALTIIRPSEKVGRVVIGTVQGDLHDIGKNLVSAMLEGCGFDVVDLGANVAPEKFVAAVQEQKPNLLALSALLTTTMPAMKRTLDALAQAQVRSQVKVIIGGAPVTQAYADEIGADGYGDNAVAAVALARRAVAA